LSGTPIERYAVTNHVAEGGTCQIFCGKRLGAGGFEMEVAFKQLLPELSQQEELLDLFIREVKLAATLDHPQIVRTIDFVTYGGEYFSVMEYVPGGPLRTLLERARRRAKRLSPAAAIHICREVLAALAYVHGKRDSDGTPLQLLHRNLSPSKILVSSAGEVKLIGFTIAEVATHSAFSHKRKIGYMSPEQAKGASLDHRSDLYSLAVCLYEALTGEPLFAHAGQKTSASKIYAQPVPQVSRKVPGLTPDLDAIMAQALAVFPAARYQHAGELQEALTRCAHRNGLLLSAPELAAELRAACGDLEHGHREEDVE
jgi:serine/threonine-protein kinase